MAAKTTVCIPGLLTVLLTGAVLAQANEAPTVLERTVYHFAPVGEYEVVVGDFHMHTTHSDGILSARDRVLETWWVGYDAFAITDHGDDGDGYVYVRPEVEKLARNLGLIQLRGLESGLSVNRQEHMVLLGLSQDYVPRNPHRWALTPEKAAETGHVYYRDQWRHLVESGWIAIYAHPSFGWREPMQWAAEQGYLTGVEVYNSLLTRGYEGEMFQGRWCWPAAFDWALEHDLAVFSNSDLHWSHEKGSHYDGGPVEPRGRTLVLVTERSPEGVLEALRDKRTLAWFPDGGERWPDSPDMLWAPPALMEAYLEAMVQVELRELDSGEAPPGRQAMGTVLRNLGAVPLQARITLDGRLVEEVTLHQAREVMLLHSDVLADLTIEWSNLWISPRENPQTSYRAVYRDGRRLWRP